MEPCPEMGIKGNKGVTLVKSKQQTCFIALLLGLLVLSSVTCAPSSKRDNQPVMDILLQKVQEVIDIPEQASLDKCSVEYDEFTGTRLWTLTWSTPANGLIELQFDINTLDLVFYIDTTRASYSSGSLNPSTTKTSAAAAVDDFLGRLERVGLLSVPDDAVSEEICQGNVGWIANWKHVYDRFTVEDDWMRIETDCFGNSVYSFTIRWHPDVPQAQPSIGQEDAQAIARTRLSDSQILVESPQLCYLPMGQGVSLAWRYETDHEVIWLDSDSGAVLRTDAWLGSPANYKDSYAYDPVGYDPYDENPGGDPETYTSAQSVYLRFKTSTSYPEGFTPRYYADKSKAFELGWLYNEKAYYHIGHGTIQMFSAKYYTSIVTTTTPLSPQDLGTTDLSRMDLAFINTCWGYASTCYPYEVGWWKNTPRSQWFPVEKNIAQGFIDHGAKCAVGWIEPVPKPMAKTYSLYFFDMAVSGFSFWASYLYARSRVNTYQEVCGESIQIDKIGGTNPNLSFVMRDNGGNTKAGATNLGTGGNGIDVTWTVANEGLWYTDVDWYKFTSVGFCYIEIAAVPVTDPYEGLNVIIDIYNSANQLIAHRDAGGIGQSESYSFNGQGTFYLYLYDSTVGPPHGGAYGFTVSVLS